MQPRPRGDEDREPAYAAAVARRRFVLLLLDDLARLLDRPVVADADGHAVTQAVRPEAAVDVLDDSRVAWSVHRPAPA